MNKLITFLLFIALLPACTSDDTLTRNEHLMSDDVGIVIDKYTKLEGSVTQFVLKIKYLYDEKIVNLKNRLKRGLLTKKEYAEALAARRADQNRDVTVVTGEVYMFKQEWDAVSLGDTFKIMDEQTVDIPPVNHGSGY